LLIEREREQDPKVRTRRRVEVALRPAEQTISADEFRLREQELERLIIKAAYRRAVRLATQPHSDTGHLSAEGASVGA